MRLVEAERGFLVGPIQGQVPSVDQALGRQMGRLIAGEDRLDDLRGEEGERHQVADIALGNTFCPGNIGERL